jgi:hypothetical protein
MDKTFTDCYYAKGFTGGGWTYASNTNDSEGILMRDEEVTVPNRERRLACYYLGWDSLEVSHGPQAKLECPSNRRLELKLISSVGSPHVLSNRALLRGDRQIGALLRNRNWSLVCQVRKA